MRMVNREMLPAVCFDIAKRDEQFHWIGVEIHARRGVRVRQWIDFPRATLHASDNAARFVWRVAARVRDELGQLGLCKLHNSNDFSAHNRLLHANVENLARGNFKNVV